MIPSDALSRAVSHALRHEPWLYELELDAQGWTSLEAMVEALRREQGLEALTVADVESMVVGAPKPRHELVDGRIRASYGHSLPDRISATPGVPPGRLFHGTSPAAAEVIRSEGLLPMGRQYVHLSVDPETAGAVGARKSPCPVTLVINAGEAAASGVVFYTGNQRVWLVDSVPASFIAG